MIKTHPEERIVSLPEKTIFVFGSNTGGIHGAGAAADALKYFGAVSRQGEGLFGQSYALPTKAYIPGSGLFTLSLQEISLKVDAFITHVKENRDNTYYLSRVGCNRAGYTDEDIYPLFMKYGIIQNIIYPEEWVALWQNT